MILFSRTSQLNPKSTPTWQSYGGCGRLRTEENIVPGQDSSAHLSRDELCWQTGPSPAAKYGHDRRRFPVHEPVLQYHSNSVPFILVGVRKGALPIVVRLLFSKLEPSFLGLILWSVILGAFPVSPLMGF